MRTCTSAEAALNYDRAVLEDRADPKTKALFDSAEADFTKAIERDGRNARAFDMRGLVHAASGDHDQAIADFAQEMTIDPRLGRLRLAEAYCNRGSSYQKAGNYDPAISDYEQAMELGVPSEGCDCQPESPLAWIYYERKQYDRSWEVVRRAREAKKWTAPELIEQLREASGRVE
jgi:tetratricopeptide (TPR) repeat protein